MGTVEDAQQEAAAQAADDTLERAEKLSYADLLELTKRIGVRFADGEPLVEDLLSVLDEGDKDVILAFLDEHGV